MEHERGTSKANQAYWKQKADANLANTAPEATATTSEILDGGDLPGQRTPRVLNLGEIYDTD